MLCENDNLSYCVVSNKDSLDVEIYEKCAFSL